MSLSGVSQNQKQVPRESPLNILLLFQYLLIATFVKKSYIQAKIQFIVPENVLKKALNSFNTKFGTQ